MANKRDPWQPVGTFIYHFIQFVANATGYQPLTGGGSMETEHTEEPEPRWLYCLPCESRTIHEPYNWVLDGETDYECTSCGAVTYV